VVRPVYFPRVNGRMEWTAPDGTEYDATFDDKLTRDLANQRLRTALDVEGDWLPAVLGQAHAQLTHLRARDPDAGGLVITIDQEHARAIAALMEERLGVTATVATSDDPGASAQIAAFGAGSAPWIVAVRMVSEGVDIPRLRVGVFATNTTTELFFRQAVGRLLRWSALLGRRQAAYMFVPDDVRLRAFAAGIAEQRRHCLRPPADDDRPANDPVPAPGERPGPADDAQLSLFSVISATPLDVNGRPLDDAEAPLFEESDDGAIPDLVEPGDGLVLSSVSPPLPDPLPPAAAAESPLARRRLLREQNSELARDLVFVTGKTHAEVNAELNRRVGLRRISEATIKQLERRLLAARGWLKSR
jgi:hypothetical protein